MQASSGDSTDHPYNLCFSTSVARSLQRKLAACCCRLRQSNMSTSSRRASPDVTTDKKSISRSSWPALLTPPQFPHKTTQRSPFPVTWMEEMTKGVMACHGGLQPPTVSNRTSCSSSSSARTGNSSSYRSNDIFARISNSMKESRDDHEWSGYHSNNRKHSHNNNWEAEENVEIAMEDSLQQDYELYRV